MRYSRGKVPQRSGKLAPRPRRRRRRPRVSARVASLRATSSPTVAPEVAIRGPKDWRSWPRQLLRRAICVALRAGDAAQDARGRFVFRARASAGLARPAPSARPASPAATAPLARPSSPSIPSNLGAASGANSRRTRAVRPRPAMTMMIRGMMSRARLRRVASLLPLPRRRLLLLLPLCLLAAVFFLLPGCLLLCLELLLIVAILRSSSSRTRAPA
jgi:hypothetical protein